MTDIQISKKEKDEDNTHQDDGIFTANSSLN
jgi:hypothetical protein